MKRNDFNKFKEKAFDTFSKTFGKIDEFSKTASVKLKIQSYNCKKDQLFEKIGKYVFENRDSEQNDEFLANLFKKIDVLNENIENLRKTEGDE